MNSVRRTYIEAIKAAHAKGKCLCIRGQGTRDFLSAPASGELIDTRDYRGIISYEPEELFMTVRSGTPLLEVEEALNLKGQHLSFEPPRWGNGGTVGGMIAAGFAGARRMRSGPLRDHLLGVEVIDGQGRTLRFGGTVIKNVAGYDVSRLFAGSWGRLGLLLDVTLKVLPKPPSRQTLVMDMEQSEALRWINLARARPWPVGASLFTGSHTGRFWVRLEGGHAAVQEAVLEICREMPMLKLDPEEADTLWQHLKTQSHPTLCKSETATSKLWRFIVPPATPPLSIEGDTMLEWEGGLRWWRGNGDTLPLSQILGEFSGWAAPFDHRFQTAWLSTGASASESTRSRIQSGVMKVLDPAGVFSHG